MAATLFACQPVQTGKQSLAVCLCLEVLSKQADNAVSMLMLDHEQASKTVALVLFVPWMFALYGVKHVQCLTGLWSLHISALNVTAMVLACVV